MQVNDMTNQVKIFSHSALHTYITGPEPVAQKLRSQTNPYRKRQGLLSFLGLNDVLAEVKREEARAKEAKIAVSEQETRWNLSQVSEA